MLLSTGSRRITAPLLDFVSTLRDAISAFGQGHIGARQELTLRQIAEVTTLLGRPLEQTDADAARLLYVGDLSPESGVVDLLSCVIAWADRHRDVPVDICWVGTGDLQGVLRAQARPANLTQSFMPLPAVDALPELFAQCSILAVPNTGAVDLLPIAQAMAMGLPVLGSARCPEARMLVPSRDAGWLFDPLSPVELSAAIAAALSTAPPRLAEMRLAARRRIRALCDGWLADRDDAIVRHAPARLATSGQV